MEPTLEPQDGFVAVPTALTGPLEKGDIVVYRAEDLHGGGLTTHRIIEHTDRGYITKGDKNPFTDQSGPEPPVKKEQIEAVALQIDGHTVVIPELGTIVTGMRDVLAAIQVRSATLLGTRSLLGTQGLAYVLFAFTLCLYTIDTLWLRERDRTRHRNRETGINLRIVVVLSALLVVGGATAAMVGGGGTQKFGIVSVEQDGPGVEIIKQGTSESIEYNVTNSGLLPEVVILEPATGGIAVQPSEMSVPRQSTANPTITLHAPPQTGYYRQFLVEHRYLALLPQHHIHALYQLHPWAPVAVIDALLGCAVYLLGATFVGTTRVRLRKCDRPSLLDRLYSKFT